MPQTTNSPSPFVSHAKVVAALTLVSRVSGLARDAVCARVFGAGPIWSAFAFAFLIPNLFRRLFGEGALASAFLPEYGRLSESDPAAARRLATLVLAGLTAGLGAVVLLAEIVLAPLLLANGPADPSRSLTISLLMIMLPYTPLICVVAILGAMLQVHGRFGPPAAAPILLNLFIIAAAAWPLARAAPFDDPAARQAIHLVAWSVLVAGVVQALWSLRALQRSAGGIGHDPAEPGLLTTLRHPDAVTRAHAGSVLRLMGPMVLGMSVFQLNTLLDGLIAYYPNAFGPTFFGLDYPLDESSLSILFFAQRLYQFPLGVFGIAVATAIFPALSRTARRDGDEFDQTLRQGLRLTVYIGLPASVGLILVREPLTAVILRGGQFTSADAARVATVLAGYAAAVWAYSMNHVLARAFYAHGDAKTPVRVAVIVVAANFALNLMLIWPLREAGLAWATAITAMGQTVLLTRAVSRFAARPIDAAVAKSWARTIAATLVMSLAVLAVDWWLRSPAESWTGQLVRLAVLTVVGGVAFALTSLTLRMEEYAWLLGRGGRPKPGTPG